jgi:lipoprotein-releasing system permease protein
MRYEFFIARRYLLARRQRFLSIIAAMAVVGIMVGVWALVTTLAFQSGMEQELRAKILTGTAHINVFRRGSKPLEDADALVKRIAGVSGVKTATATTYKTALLSGANGSVQGVLKAIDLNASPDALEVTRTLLPGGKLAGLARTEYPDGTTSEGVIIGKRLAEDANLKINDTVKAIIPEGRGELTPAGLAPEQRSYRVVGIFESGLYEYDSAWAYISMDAARSIVGEGEAATVVQVTLADLYAVDDVSRRIKSFLKPDYVVQGWPELNQTAFTALNLQRLAFSVVITLIIVVAALNIVTTLIMLVVEKKRDIAILTAMGATSRAILLVFMLQGLALGLFGTIIGAAFGVTTALVCDAYKLIQLDARIYSIAFVPFRLAWIDTFAVAVIALGISFVATLYPAWRASRLDPVEGIRAA